MSDPLNQSPDQLLAEILSLEEEIDKILERTEQAEIQDDIRNNDVKKVKEYQDFINTKQNILNTINKANHKS